MKNFVRFAVAAAILAAAPAAAQTGQPGADTARGRRWEQGAHRHEGRKAFQGLLARRQELGLTDAQVSRLEEIGRRLDARNAPLRAQLATHRQHFVEQRRAQMERLTPEQRRDTLQKLRRDGRRREIPEAMRAPMAQMRENTRAAMQEAQGVLTPQQKERARELMREGRQGRRGRMEGEAAQRGRQPHLRRGGWNAEGQPQGGTPRP